MANIIGLDEPAIVDILAFIMTILYTVVPFAFFYQYTKGVIKRNSISILGILCLYLNGLTYFMTTLRKGIKDEDAMRLRDFSNLSGAILGFGYCLYYDYILYYYKDYIKKFYIYLFLILITLPIMILIVIFVDPEIVEYIGVLFNIFEYLPLGFNLLYLIQHKIGNRYILFSAIPGIINTIIWIIWASIKIDKETGYEKKKIHSLISNILGFLLCLTQFIIISVFKSDDHPNDSIIESTNDINMKENVEEEKKENSDLDEIMIL